MKNKRQETLLNIIRDNVVTTQEELTEHLLANGFKVTQSTVSRDIRELKITKAHDSSGNYRYVSTAKNNDFKDGDSEKFADIFSSSVISVRSAMNDVVIHCYSGMASGACVAVDRLFKDMIIGSLAGDDTIFIITESTAAAEKLTDCLKKLI